VVKLLLPVRIGEPPVATLYQSTVSFALTNAVNVTTPVPHLEESDPVGGLIAPTFAVIAKRLSDTQPVEVFLALA